MPSGLIVTELGVLITKTEARRRLGEAQGNKCCFCGVTLTWHMRTPLKDSCATLEHIVPQFLGGVDHMTNLAVSCNRCNNRRGITSFEDYKNYAMASR